MIVWGVAFAASPCFADIGIFFDVTSLGFQYQVTNSNAGVGDVIGTISISDSAFSNMMAQKLDLGGDGFGGGNDSLLDLANIGSGDDFDALFTANVVVGPGGNNFQIAGSLSATDTTLGDPSVTGDFSSFFVSMQGGVFSFGGDLVKDINAGQDSLLLDPNQNDSWVFTGLSGDTPSSPDEDGTQGEISLDTGRTLFGQGTVGEFHFAGFGSSTLNEFFSQDQQSSTAELKISIVPEPTTITLLILGGACTFLLRRRLSSCRPSLQ